MRFELCEDKGKVPGPRQQRLEERGNVMDNAVAIGDCIAGAGIAKRCLEATKTHIKLVLGGRGRLGLFQREADGNLIRAVVREESVRHESRSNERNGVSVRAHRSGPEVAKRAVFHTKSLLGAPTRRLIHLAV